LGVVDEPDKDSGLSGLLEFNPLFDSDELRDDDSKLSYQKQKQRKK